MGDVVSLMTQLESCGVAGTLTSLAGRSGDTAPVVLSGCSSGARGAEPGVEPIAADPVSAGDLDGIVAGDCGDAAALGCCGGFDPPVISC